MLIETLDPNATYVVSGNEDFVVGQNIVTIEVTSSNGIDKETYVLNVNRQLSSNNYLDYIITSHGELTPKYEKTKIYYEVYVDTDVSNINIDAEPSDSKATLTGIGNYVLEKGSNLINLEVTSVTGITRTYTVNVIRAKNSNNYLGSLTVKNGSSILELNPLFDKNTDEYTVTIEEGTTRLQILATAESEFAKISGTGYVAVNPGENRFNVVVTAEDGTTRTYIINAYRPKYTNNNLTEIIPSVGNLSPAFTYGLTTYNLTLGNLDSLLSFEVNTENRFATVSGTDEMEVPDGESVRIITVTSENGETQDYTINVFRQRTDDARLSSLAVKSFNLDQEFDEDLFKYTMTVPNDKFELTENEIVAVPKYENSTVYLTPMIELSVLNINKYIIVVTAPDGYTTQEYEIDIVREKSSDASLSKLAVSGCEITPAFDPDELEYTVKIPRDKFVLDASDVIAVAKDRYATVEKMERIDLLEGENVYKVFVTSHDKSNSRTYILHVENEKSEDNYLESLTVSPGILTPAFDTNEVNYEVHVRKNQSTINIEAEARHPFAEVVAGTGKIELEDYQTQILVLVKAEDEKLRGYIIDVYRDLEVTDIVGKVETENVNRKYKADVKVLQEGVVKYQTSTNESGQYVVVLDPGVYDVLIEKEGYLDYTIKDVVVLKDETVEVGTHKLIAGDVVKNGEIELDDLVAVNENLGKDVNESNKAELSKYDFNEDKVIDSLDREIIISNYGSKAVQVTWVKNEVINAIVENSVEEKLTKNVVKQSAPSVKDVDNEEKKDYILPITSKYSISSDYGTRIHPISGEESFHSGIDLVGDWHTEVLAVADGIVTYSGVQSGYGNCVELKHNVNGVEIYTFYAHLSKINVEKGEEVIQGKVIGLEGGASSDPNHGTSTGHHLHFEFRKRTGSGNSLNPWKYITF